MKTDCDIACAILSGTNDGNNLSPSHLYLVQEFINGNLTEEGIALIHRIESEVTQGKYQPPWFHGVEHMTVDSEGFVYYKKKNIEHFSGRYRYTEEAKEFLLKLAKACESLEKKNPLPDEISNLVYQEYKILYPEGKEAV